MSALALTQLLAPARVSLERGRPPAFAIDVSAVERACAEYDLALPVVIRCTNGRRYSGLYAAAPDRHVISVACWLTPEQASRTLWHELTHAMQRESGTFRSYSQRNRTGARYRAEPNEVEAEASESNHERMALARPLA